MTDCDLKAKNPAAWEALCQYRRLVDMGVKRIVAAKRVGYSREWIRHLDKTTPAESQHLDQAA
jgi:hypothetical protein